MESKPDDENDPRNSPPKQTQRWLSRLAMSFFIIAFYLIWQAFHLHQQASTISPQVRQTIYLIGAGASFAMGVLGIKVRHRHL